MHKIQGDGKKDETNDYDPVKFRPPEELTSYETNMPLIIKAQFIIANDKI